MTMAWLDRCMLILEIRQRQLPLHILQRVRPQFLQETK
jgi:hypothetical protein